MKKLLAVIAAVMFVFLGIFPACAAGNQESNVRSMFVNNDNGGSVRVMSIPSQVGKVVSYLNVGRPMTVVGQYESGWSEVKYQVSGKMHYGYIMTKNLSAYNPAAQKQTFREVSKDVRVKVLPANARGVVSLWSDTTKSNESKIRDLTRTEELTVIAASRAWFQVRTEDGLVGYVAKAYVRG